jgi:hypothetical protein
MRTETFIINAAGGLEEQLPQQPANAEQVENWRLDRRSGGWSSRLGYEPFRPGNQGTWDPFASDGPVYGLHCAQALAGGARQHLLYCEGGNLCLLYEARATGVAPQKVVMQSGRSVPAPTEPGPTFLDTPHGTVVCNGYDRPVLVKPWPLSGDSIEASSTISQCIRALGFEANPAPPTPRRVQPMPVSVASSTGTGGGAVTLWCLADTEAVSDGGRWGIGFKENTGSAPGQQTLVSYACSFITDTGSEGPRSTLATTTWELENGANGFRYATALTLPYGPAGTVARKVYRTANYSDDAAVPGDTTLYFVGLIRNNVDDVFFDAASSAALDEPAPLVNAGPFPAPRARFSAMFRQCLFLDGGVDDAYTLYYSAPSRIEQFSVLQSLELGSEGGGITALYGDYTLLVVFRERGIDVVQGDYVAGFTVSTIDRTVEVKAPHSVQRVPGLGVLFLASDGVYAVTGGLQGGAVLDIVKLSAGYEDTIARITPDCQARAVSVYSAARREYQLYVPTDGNDRPDLALVLHTDKLQRSPDVSPWSTRTGFPVGAITTTQAGEVVFGHNTGNETGNNTSERGLFVISGRRSMGGTLSADVVPVFQPGAAPTSTYRSAWNDFGDPQLLKQVQYVTVWVMTTGNPQVTLRWYKDFSLTATTERTYVMQPPDSSALAVYDSAVLGVASYRNERMVPLRYAVAVQSCAHFAFEIETSDDIVLIGFEYGYTVKGTEVARGRRA